MTLPIILSGLSGTPTPETTSLLATGFETGLDEGTLVTGPNSRTGNGGDGITSLGVAGTAVYTSTVVHSGSQAILITPPSGSVGNILLGPAAAAQRWSIAGQAYIYLTGYPSTTIQWIRMEGPGDRVVLTAAGAPGLQVNGISVAGTQPVVPLNEWHRWEVAQTGHAAGDIYTRFRVYGTDDSTVLAEFVHRGGMSAPALHTGITFGKCSATGDMPPYYIDDVAVLSGATDVLPAVPATQVAAGSGQLTGDGQIVGGATAAVSGTGAGLTGDGTVSGGGAARAAAAGALAGGGTITAASIAATGGTGTLSGSGEVTTSSEAVGGAVGRSAPLQVAFTPPPVQIVGRSDPLQVAYTPPLNLGGTGTLSGTGQVTATAAPRPVGTSTLGGSGQVTAASLPAPASTGVLSGAGTVTAAGLAAPQGTGLLSGSGTIAAAPSAPARVAPTALLTTAGDYSTATSGTTTLTSLSVAKPANVQAGDLLLALISHQFAPTATSTLTETTSTWQIVGPPFDRTSGTTRRAATTWALAVTSPEQAAALPTTWTWTTNNGSARWTAQIFRVTGADLASGITSAIDSHSDYSLYGGTATQTIPAWTRGTDNDLLLAFAVAQNNSSVATPQSWTVPGYTSGQPGAYLQAIQTTGSWSAGFIAAGGAAAAGAEPATAYQLSSTATGSMGWALGVRGVMVGGASGSGTGALSGAGTVSGTRQRIFRRGYASPAEMLAQPLAYAAHRGGSYDYPEMSLYAYQQAALDGYPALEVSLARTSDGVWFGLHDASLDRTSLGTGGGSGTTLVASTMTWAQVQQYSILGSTATNNTGQAARPYMRWEELIAEFYDTHLLFVDPKAAYSYRAELIAMMQALPGNPRDHFVGKFYGVVGPANNANGWARELADLGYKTWGYFYDTDAANFATYAPRWSILGLEWLDTQTYWDQLRAAAPGRPVLAHIIATPTQLQTGLARGPQGFMVSGVRANPVPDIVPYSAGTGQLAGSGTVTAAAAPGPAGTGVLSGAGQVSSAAAAQPTGTGQLGGAGTITAASKAAAAELAALSGQGTVTAVGGGAAPGVGTLTGSGTLTSSTRTGTAQPGALAGAGTVTAARTPAVTQPGQLSGEGTVTAAGGGTAPGTGTVTGSGTITGTPSSTAAAGAGSLTGAGTVAAVTSPAPAQLGTLTGSGAVTAVRVPAVAQPGQLSSSGTVTAAASPAAAQLGVLSGAGTVTSAGAGVAAATGSLTGSGVVTAAARAATQGAGTLTGSGTLTTTGGTTGTAAGSLTGSGQVSGTGASLIAAAGPLTGSGTVTAARTITTSGQGVLTGSGTLSAAGGATQLGAGTGSQSGNGSVQGGGFPTPAYLGLVSGSGTVTAATGITRLTAGGQTTGQGTITGLAGGLTQKGTGELGGLGAVTGEGGQNQTAPGLLTGTGEVVGVGMAYLEPPERTRTTATLSRGTTATLSHDRAATLTRPARAILDRGTAATLTRGTTATLGDADG